MAWYNLAMTEEIKDKFVVQLEQDFPQFNWREGTRFRFRPPRTIYYEKDLVGNEYNNYCLQLLHELGHAVLGHRDFRTDLDRLKMEVAAWEQARQFAAQYNIYYDEELVQEQLDSYRGWLHGKSRCKKCGLTRYQTKDGEYHCPQCDL